MTTKPHIPTAFPKLDTSSDPQLQILDHAATLLIQIDTATMKIGAHNATAAETFGPIADEVCYQRLMNLDKRCQKCRALEAYVTKKTTSTTVQLPDGRWIKLSWKPAPTLPGKSVIEAITDITDEIKTKEQLAQKLDQLEEQATTDPLTQLMNRHAWFRFAERHADQAIQRQVPIELLLVDIDHFKQINDTYGHLVGDKAIMHLAAILRNVLRPTDFIGRYGGEEFAVLLNPETGNPTDLAEQLRATVAHTTLNVPEVPHPIKMTVSIGAGCAMPAHPVTHAIDALIRETDRALYASKRNGRNRVTMAGHEPPIPNHPTPPSVCSETFVSRTRKLFRRLFPDHPSSETSDPHERHARQ